MKENICSRIIGIVFSIVVLMQLGGFATVIANAAITQPVKVTSITLNTNKLNLKVDITDSELLDDDEEDIY